jgi:hypothetical protein
MLRGYTYYVSSEKELNHVLHGASTDDAFRGAVDAAHFDQIPKSALEGVRGYT